MTIKQLQSGDILRSTLILIALLSVIFMPQSGQASLLEGLADILINIVVPITAPIAFVILLMDIIIYSATAENEQSKKQKTIMAIEGVLCVFILLRWLPYVLSPLE